MNFFIFEQLPVLAPIQCRSKAAWDSQALELWLRSRAAELTYTADDLRSAFSALAEDKPPFRWDEDRRFLLKAELDAAYFHLYGVERDGVDYIMDTFPIVKRKDEAKYGEYRTKRLILEIYDAMAEATRTGEPYRTILDPPPGQGLRHPARDGRGPARDES